MPSSRVWSLGAALASSAIVACSSGPTSPSLQTPPEVHREAPSCDPTRPSGNGQGRSGPGMKCSRDSDCTAGKNGRCTVVGLGAVECTYDACASDDDCSGGGICGCRAGAGRANVCVRAGNCRSDADCPGQYCALSTKGTCGGTGLLADTYYCTTRLDTCRVGSDCQSQNGIGGAAACRYEPELGHFACVQLACVAD